MLSCAMISEVEIPNIFSLVEYELYPIINSKREWRERERERHTMMKGNQREMA